ncbi:MAG: RNA-directed DNA polymerase [Clostridia bacterium]|nr:RNA-directed DNA polymerase [Clostridia bacterium]
MHKHCLLHGLKSKKQLISMLDITDNKVMKGKAQDKIKIYIATEPKKRLIEAPEYKIKKVQNKIKNYLLKCDLPSYVFSGIKGKSYFCNAALHRDCKFLYKTDISAFFPSISRNTAYKFFKNDLETSSDVAKILTDICTVDIRDTLEKDSSVAGFVKDKKIKMYNHLCTGSPASPILSYLVNKAMFDEMYAIAENNNLKFSIYMDDVFFSSSKSISNNVREHILRILTKYGYNVSFKKVIYYTSQQNKKVTGVIITPQNKLSIPNKLRRKIIASFSKGNLKTGEQNLRGMLVASNIIEKNSFSGIKRYLNELSKIQ